MSAASNWKREEDRTSKSQPHAECHRTRDTYSLCQNHLIWAPSITYSFAHRVVFRPTGHCLSFESINSMSKLFLLYRLRQATSPSWHFRMVCRENHELHLYAPI